MAEIVEEFAFGRYRLRPGQRLLLRDGEPVPLGGRAFDLLEAMIEQPGQLLTRDTLIKRVWSGLFVHENNLAVHVSALRQVLGQNDEGERYITTIPGRGYRFTVTVTAHAPVDALRPAAPAPAAQGNLRHGLDRIVGRSEEVAAVVAALDGARLVTIVGPGGIGKTRVALAAAEQCRVAAPGGVWLVDLTAAAEASLVPGEIARVLEVEASGSAPPLDRVAHRFGDVPFLIILDNCEHLAAACAAAAAALMERCRQVRILTTSQQRLGLPGEHIIRLPPLSAPPAQLVATAASLAEYSACTLLVDRVGAIDPDFVLTDSMAPSIAEISRRLDGIPLAIELAAARIPFLGLEGLRRRLDDRLRLLAGGRRTGRPTHKTLRATLEMSFGLLSLAEQATLTLLAVFHGGFSLEAGSAVALAQGCDGAEFFDRLVALTEWSFLQVVPTGGEPRYRLLETTRLYLLEQLATAPLAEAARHAHAAYLAGLLEAAEEVWETTETQSWTGALVAELDNVRAALAWCFEPDGDRCIGHRLIAASLRLWSSLGLMKEGSLWFERATALPLDGVDPVLAARLWTGVTRLALSLPGRIEAAHRAVDLARQGGDPAVLGRALTYLGEAQRRQAQWAEADRAIAEAAPLLRDSGAEKSAAEAIHQWSVIRERLGDPARSRALNADALVRFRAVGHVSGIIACLVREANLDVAVNHVADAIRATREAVRLAREARNLYMLELALTNLASYLLLLGRIDEAEAVAREALPVARRIEDRVGVAVAAQHLATAASHRGHQREAVCLLAFSEAIYAVENEPRDSLDQASHDSLVAALTALVPPEDYAMLAAIGAGWTEDHVMAAVAGQTAG